jgi:TetR/AcrR family transcriptional regulator
VFARINQIMEEEKQANVRCARILYLVLGFSARNPGITRVLLGDALVGETERLHGRVEQFFSRLETQLRQVLREARMREGSEMADAETGAGLMLALVEGRMHQFLRTRFKTSPVADWDRLWGMVEASLFNS